MTEKSRPWQAGVGDGAAYSDEDWRLIMETLGLATGANIGVVQGILNGLAVTSTGDNNITVDTGRAIVDGTVYENDASKSLTSNDPGGAGTTGRRCVLRKDWTLRTVRLAIISSADDVTTLPALTQTDGVTFEIPIASFQIAPSGAITQLADEREWTLGSIPSGKQYVSDVSSNRYSAPGWEVDNYSGQAISGITDRIIFQLIVVPQPITFTRIAFKSTVSAGAGEEARVGIYAADKASDGFTPGRLILDGGSSHAIDAAPADFEDTIAITLQGVYFLALTTDATSGSLSGPVATSYVNTPIIGVGITAFVNQQCILQTDANAGANWHDGLPTEAPAVTGYLPVEYAMIQLGEK